MNLSSVRTLRAAAFLVAISLISPVFVAQRSLLADDEAPWDIPDGDFYRELESLNTYDDSEGGVQIRVSVVQDAFAYFISRGCGELNRAGYEGKALERKLKSLYSKYKKEKGRVLFIVEISGSGSGKYAFYLNRKPEKHLQIKTGAKKHTLTVVEQSHKPKARVWETYQYVPGAPRKVGKRKLYPADDHRMLITCRTIKGDSRKPIKMVLSGMFHSHKSNAAVNSLGVNDAQGQISMRRWNEQIIRSIELPIAPNRWREADMPRDLERLCERLTKKK